MSGSRNVIAAFSEEQTEKLTGITRSQLRYWDRTGFYSPSYAEENHRAAFSRIYSFKDIVALRVLFALRKQYSVSLQYLREVSKKLASLGSDPKRWTAIQLYVFNKRVIWHEPGTELPQEITTGQYLVPLKLKDVVNDTKASVELQKSKRDPRQIGSIEKSRHVLHNAPVLAGTRIPVNAIKRFHQAGYSVDQILSEYPDLTEQDVSAALEYNESASAA